ncbi:MAG TPA: septal ring lytic transglycosylase RlpA family protein [Candidatus Saccharimonadia bacterium]|nr:septal ring lytic transglycosylase RlpA family protein [Candidatus Saccharimonadia bacterium]
MNRHGRAAALVCAALLGACKPQVREAPPVSAVEAPRASRTAAPRKSPAPRELSDGGPAVPPDVSRVPEPVPKVEPLARYGNKSPYTVLGRTYSVRATSRGYRERGLASWYGTKFHGRLTSSREPYDMYKMTAAHKTLPLPCYVRVTNLENGRSLVVRVNDRGPFHEGRIIDLSYTAAIRLGVHLKGTARVEVESLDAGAPDAGIRYAARPVQSPGPVASAPARRGRGGAGNAREHRVLLQVGSFTERDNAKRLERALEAKNLDHVYVDRERVHGHVVHRVRIGPLVGASADALVARLRTLGYPSVVVAPE